MIAIIIAIIKNNKDSKSNNSYSNNNDNDGRSYGWSYVSLIEAFLKLAFYNYE